MTSPKPSRAREMTAADKRRVNLVDVIHDQGITVKDPDPARDQWGEPLPVVQDDDHRSLLHLDGKGEPRVPEAVEEKMAKDARESFSRERAAMTASLKRSRSSLPTHERLRIVEKEIDGLQTVKARQATAAPTKGASSSPDLGGTAECASCDWTADVRTVTVLQRHVSEHRKTGHEVTITRRSGARLAHRPSAGGSDGGIPFSEGAGAIAHADPLRVTQIRKMIKLGVKALEELLDEHRGFAHRSYVLMPTEDKDALLVGAEFRDLSPAQVHALHTELGTAKHIGYVRRLAGLDDYGNKREQAA